LDAGVTVAIGPDWGITGSANILDELQIAASWNSLYLSNLLSDKQLVDMVTMIPAEIAGISEYVGTISEGKFADLIVISGDLSSPYRALIDGGSESIKLVLVDGVPVYGELALMERFWDQGELSQIEVSGKIKALRLDRFDQMVSELELALADNDFELAPISENVEIALAEMVIDLKPEEIPTLTSGSISWDDAIYFFGEKKTVCGTVVDDYYSEDEDRVPSNLYIGQPYPNINRFAIYLPSSARESFRDNFENTYLNQEICVTGEIVSYEGAAEIIVTDPSQITKP